MLRHVATVATERRLRLLAVACQRWTYPFASGELEAVMLAVERVADGVETIDDIAMLDALADWNRQTWNAGPGHTVTVDGVGLELPIHRFNEIQRTAQCSLIRDIFGNPFRTVTLDRAWTTTPVISLAQTMYDSRDFAAMPVLADALEEAGCDNADILAHCRGPGPHVRGCWVVDLALGRS
jgi:hypothetical protein